MPVGEAGLCLTNARCATQFRLTARTCRVIVHHSPVCRDPNPLFPSPSTRFPRASPRFHTPRPSPRPP
ncbi:hypothetical protein BN12_3950001 [Nostocoides japonicum T1-X7]|uniref:Uncharacterized protein n=1 Tax=Nostocoides japonicum T1-X7 TaxID=1194083 RepID=A0A077LZE4_9MICO|nr:hypothetical protein BN12_3950001 [Tetrasphaera japonica T1-X7]